MLKLHWIVDRTGHLVMAWEEVNRDRPVAGHGEKAVAAGAKSPAARG